MTNKEFIKEILYSLKNFPEDWGGYDDYDIRHKKKFIKIMRINQRGSLFDSGMCCISSHGTIYFKFFARIKLRKAIRKMTRNNIINNLYETN